MVSISVVFSVNLPTYDHRDCINHNDDQIDEGHASLRSSITHYNDAKLNYLGPSAGGWPINLNLNNFSFNDLRLLPDSHANALAERLHNNADEVNKTKNARIGHFQDI